MAVATFMEVRCERSGFHIKAERHRLTLAADFGYVNIFLPGGKLIVAITEDGNSAKYPSQTSVSPPA